MGERRLDDPGFEYFKRLLRRYRNFNGEPDLL